MWLGTPGPDLRRPLLLQRRAAIEPEQVGVRMTLPLGKHSGRHAFARACTERGLHLTADELNAAFRRFKERADAGGAVTLEDVFEGVTA